MRKSRGEGKEREELEERGRAASESQAGLRKNEERRGSARARSGEGRVAASPGRRKHRSVVDVAGQIDERRRGDVEGSSHSDQDVIARVEQAGLQRPELP